MGEEGPSHICFVQAHIGPNGTVPNDKGQEEMESPDLSEEGQITRVLDMTEHDENPMEIKENTIHTRVSIKIGEPDDDDNESSGTERDGEGTGKRRKLNRPEGRGHTSRGTIGRCQG